MRIQTGHTRSAGPPLRRAVLLAVVATLVATLLPLGATAEAAPRTRAYGPLIEGYAPYQGQSTCSPKDKPGMVAFANLLRATYGNRWIGIGRSCNVGGKSEHKEGRAIDWSMDATKAADRRKVNDLMKWLFATDRYGNRHAMARRLGVMYVIWNRRWWTSWNRGWETYCVQRKRGCVSPRDGGLNHPHADHVHISFSWSAARKRTSFFAPARSFVMGMAGRTTGHGYRLAGGDGSVHGFGLSNLGSRAGTFPKHPLVGMASTPSGGGYWLLLRSGVVHRYGNAAHHGRSTGIRAVDIASTPTGKGYWILDRDGRVDAFGDARLFGRPRNKGRMAAIAPTPSGKGYWVFGRDRRVHAFGDAPHLGQLKKGSVAVVDGAAHPGGGYWLLLRNGKVRAFGSAATHGQPSGVPGLVPAKAIVPSPTGGGYVVVGRTGRVGAFGDAQLSGSLT